MRLCSASPGLSGYLPCSRASDPSPPEGGASIPVCLAAELTHIGALKPLIKKGKQTASGNYLLPRLELYSDGNIFGFHPELFIKRGSLFQSALYQV